jgi:hypothetical protein
MREIANPSEPDYQDIPEVAQIDELQTPVGKKQTNCSHHFSTQLTSMILPIRVF